MERTGSAKKVGLKELVSLSRYYGRREEFVIAGGGNTSYKDDTYLFIKASGTTLAELSEAGLVRMRRDRLDAIWKRSYDRDPKKREAQALSDLLAAREAGEERRPSVETLLHELLRQRYVVHLHPSLVNGLTCARRGAQTAREIFGDGMIWIPVVNPGYVLACAVKEAIDRHLARRSGYPNLLFLENHGIFVAADTPEEIRSTYGRVMAALESRLTERPDLSERPPAEPALSATIAELIGRALGVAPVAPSAGAPPDGGCSLVLNREVASLVATKRSFAPLRSLSYTPDHIVYCGHEPVWVARPRSGRGARSAAALAPGERSGDLLRMRPPEAETGEPVDSPLDAAREAYAREISREVARYRRRNGHAPRVVAVQGIGLYVCGENASRLESARAMLRDAIRVAVYSRSFGGPRLMPRDKRDFIRGWEVEHYRASINAQRGKEPDREK